MPNKFDAILVLGVGTKKKLFAKRVEKAMGLYKQGVAKKIIFSGRYWGGLKIKPIVTEATAMSRYALVLGLPKKDIYLEQRSLNTIGNFYFTKKCILKPNILRRLLIVTHGSHLEKVKYLAKKILGPTYRLTFAADDKRLGASSWHIGKSDIAPFFKNIKDGDDKKVLALLRAHPYYARYRDF